MQTAPFTVLMAVYKNDQPKLFDRALDSVYKNTLTPSKVLLVVDGPIPNSIKEIIYHYQLQFNLDVLFLDENVGLANALNQGLNRIDTPWVVRADADDINLEQRFETLAGFMNEKFDLVGSAIQEVDHNGKLLEMRAPPLTQKEIIQFAKRRNPFNHMSVCFRLSMAKACGGYPNIFLKEDYALWALMLGSGAKVLNLATPLVHATAGQAMFKRRGGLKYVFAEIQLQKHLIRTGINNLFFAVLFGISRSIVYLMPSVIRGFIYTCFLRT
jgi:glycosyltransferase involved in cell wall biosynthesis